MTLTTTQIERIQSALKDVSYGKLIVTVRDGKPSGYIVEKSETFDETRLTDKEKWRKFDYDHIGGC
jgi:hypothetical protein